MAATCPTYRCGNDLDPSMPYCSRCGVQVHQPSGVLSLLGLLLALAATWAATAGAVFVLAGWSPNFGSYLTITLIAIVVSILLARVVGALAWRLKTPEFREAELTRRRVEAAWQANICQRCRQRDVAGLPYCPACGNKQSDSPLPEQEDATRRAIERAWSVRRVALTRDLEQWSRELKQMSPEEKAAARSRVQAKMADMDRRREDGG